jgi:hypothetical protein
MGAVDHISRRIAIEFNLRGQQSGSASVAHLTFGPHSQHGLQPNVRCESNTRIIDLLVLLLVPTLALERAAEGTKCRNQNTRSAPAGRRSGDGSAHGCHDRRTHELCCPERARLEILTGRQRLYVLHLPVMNCPAAVLPVWPGNSPDRCNISWGTSCGLPRLSRATSERQGRVSECVRPSPVASTFSCRSRTSWRRLHCGVGMMP